MNYQSPSEIQADFIKSAAQKTSMSPGRQIVYSVIGGALIAMGGLLAVTLAGGMPGVTESNPGITRFLFGAVFPVGLIMIVIGGAQLFTSDCAVLPFGVLAGKIKWTKLVYVWTVVYLANFLGAFLIAYAFGYLTGGLTAEPYKTFTINLAVAKTSAPFLKVFIKAIGANWLVCLAVWMSYAAKDVSGKVIALWIPVMCFVVLGFEHSIANMFFVPAAMLQGAEISAATFIINNLVPATLGNIAGGAILVAGVYWYVFSHANTKVSDNGIVRNGHHTTFRDFEKRLN